MLTHGLSRTREYMAAASRRCRERYGAREVVELPETKLCRKCSTVKPATDFHRKKTNRDGLQSWCKVCTPRQMNRPTRTVEERQASHFWSRYKLRMADIARMIVAQNNTCALCPKTFGRFVVDHDAITKRVRGLLCHGCNAKIRAIDDGTYYGYAVAYLVSGSAHGWEPIGKRSGGGCLRRAAKMLPKVLAAQGGRCGICESIVAARWVLDHEWSTGRIRGVLCQRCNIYLPAVEDENWRRAALDYVFEEVDWRTGSMTRRD